MTTLDERARDAARELREEADRRGVPDVAELLGRPAPSRRPLLAVAAAVMLVVLAVAVLVGRGDDAVDVASVRDDVPEEVVPVEWSPGNLGLSLQVPEGWREAGPLSGFAHSMVSGDGAYVLATLVLDQEARSVFDFAVARREELERDAGAEAMPVEWTVVDGRRSAAVWTYRLSDPAAGRGAFEQVDLLEYVVDMGDRLRLLVTIGEPLPIDELPLREWIASSIEVRDANVEVPSVEHPVPTAPPSGVVGRPWEPAGLGVALDVPADWSVDVGVDHRFPHEVGGGATEPFVLAGRFPAATGSPEARAAARRTDSEVEASATVEVDGRPAAVTRYSYRLGDAGAAIQLEYVVDLGDGTHAVLVFGQPVTAPVGLTDWVRSTIRITG